MLQTNDINKIYHKYVGSKVTKINNNLKFAVYNCHLKKEILTRFTLEYEHIRKIRGFTCEKITDVTQFN